MTLMGKFWIIADLSSELAERGGLTLPLASLLAPTALRSSLPQLPAVPVLTAG